MFSQEIKGETVDEDLQNLDPAFLQGMNLHNLVCPPFLFTYSDYFDELEISHNIYVTFIQVREFEMDSGGSHLGILALADDTLAGLNDNDS